MSLSDVYEGRMTWAEYLRQQAGLLFTPVQAPALKLALSERDYHLTREAGLGALTSPSRSASNAHTLEVDLHTLAQGLTQLQADF
jgi:hypothetical protein